MSSARIYYFSTNFISTVQYFLVNKARNQRHWVLHFLQLSKFLWAAGLDQSEKLTSTMCSRVLDQISSTNLINHRNQLVEGQKALSLCFCLNLSTWSANTNVPYRRNSRTILTSITTVASEPWPNAFQGQGAVIGYFS